jgi:hypothetical protein
MEERFMKRVVLLALLALALPGAAVADTVDFSITGGTMTITPGPVTLTGASVAGVTVIPGVPFTPATASSVSMMFPSSLNPFVSGTFGSGGSLSVSATAGGVMYGFTGTFTNGVWMVNPGGYGFIGNAQGTLTWGSKTFVTNLVIDTGSTVGTCAGPTAPCSVPLGSADLQTSTVPEPGTLGLLGTGLIGLAGTIRRKLLG